MSNMSDIINNTPEGKKAVEKAVRQSIADQEAMTNTDKNETPKNVHIGGADVNDGVMSNTTVDEQKSGWWDDYDMASLKDISNIMMDCCIDVMANAKRGKTTEEALNEAGDYVRKMADYIHRAKKDLLAEVGEKVISRAKPEPLPAGSVVFVDNDESTEKACYDLGIDIYERNLLAAIKEIEEGL